MLLTIRNQALRGEFLVEADPHPVSQPEERQYQLCGKNPTVFRKLGNAFSRLSSKSEQRCMIYGRARSLALNCAFFIFLFVSDFVEFLLLCFFELLGYSCDWAFSDLLELVIWNSREHF